MKRFITHIKEGTLYHAVEFNQTDGEASVAFISVKKKKNTLDVLEQAYVPDAAALSGKFGKNAPVFLLINTPQVLTRVVPVTSGDAMTLINSAFPNIKTDDFYYEWAVSGNNCIVAICRKEHAHEVIRKCNDAAISISGFSLGVLQLLSVKDFIAEDGIALPHTNISLKNKAITAVEKSEARQHNTYTINGITLENDYLLGFAAVLSAVVKHQLSRSNFDALNTNLSAQLHSKRFFSVFLKSGLGILLALLLTNYFFFSYYYDHVETLQQTVTIKSADKEQLLELRSRVDDKQARIEAILGASSSKSSLYLDKVATALPSSVLLSAFTYQSLEKPLKQGDEIVVKRGSISISGVSKDNTAFSNWVEAMEKWDWVRQVSIRDYDYNSAISSTFAIQILLRHEP